MKIRITTDYATRILLYLAIKGETANSKEISINNGISQKYVLKIMKVLIDSGLIRNKRGRDGGFMLGKDPSEINLYDIIALLEGPVDFIEDISKVKTDARPINYVYGFYNRLKDEVKVELKETTLDKIILNSRI